MGRRINSGATYQWLEQGKRLHLQHGPIDLIVEAHGERKAVAVAYEQAHAAFQDILTGLVEELALLRQALGDGYRRPKGVVANGMVDAALPYAKGMFVTPMIAVAGAVADYVLQAMLEGVCLSRAYVNNGGDIALWLADGEQFMVGICDDAYAGGVGSRVALRSTGNVQGIATSGWRGRSHSLGIADAVTVMAGCAASADVAATLIGNAVDVVGCEGVHRQRACELAPDSDLGERLVTVGVDRLSFGDVSLALGKGERMARELVEQGLVESVYMSLQGSHRVCTQQFIGSGAMHA